MVLVHVRAQPICHDCATRNGAAAVVRVCGDENEVLDRGCPTASVASNEPIPSSPSTLLVSRLHVFTVPNKGLHVPTISHSQALFGDKGRLAPMTKPYRPLGTPDHSLRDREFLHGKKHTTRGLDAGTSLVQSMLCAVVDSPRWVSSAAIAQRKKRLQALAGNKSMFDIMQAREKKQGRKVTSSKSLDKLKKYRRTGNKQSGIEELKHRIHQSRQRMTSVKAGHRIKTERLARAAAVSSREQYVCAVCCRHALGMLAARSLGGVDIAHMSGIPDFRLEAQWEREAEVAELLLRRKPDGSDEEDSDKEPDSVMAQEGMALLRKNLGRHYLPYQ